MTSGFEDSSIFDLFRMEAEEQVRVLQTELIQLEAGAASVSTLESLMRASHSLKGAARIVGLDLIVRLTHAMEDRFVAAQDGDALNSEEIDRMLAATDLLSQLQVVEEGNVAFWVDSNAVAIEVAAAGLQDQSSVPKEKPLDVDSAIDQTAESDVFEAEGGENPPLTEPDTRSGRLSTLGSGALPSSASVRSQ